MMEMSLQRLLLYYTASLNLPYIIEVQAPQADSRQEIKADNNATEIKQGNKTIRKEKKGLWEIETITVNN
ncbi:hypothetical protein N4239_11740 [Brachyspira hyodysenteriae]|uniref:hypothetical protein n=1 Tax=Brachyspira hyodysenteriae TaxID=159 RepID=UPI002B258A6C|nr:hypothetical protein [Brachyspira hyodysenteriae]WPC23605.1 hypothetical protein N4239_11740 [Brachyspira hyodysenteriae]